MRTLVFFTFLSCLMMVQVLAWWETGHMLVAQIAKQDLLENYPNIYKRAEDISLFVKGLTSNLSDTFIESAVWMDDIKNEPWNSFFEWHFIDRPYNPLGLSVQPIDKYNSIYAVDEAVQVLNNSKTRGLTTLSKSVYLRLLLHVIGDLHQPLHDACLYNLTYPDGDMGGNLEIVVVEALNQSYPLHSYWDAVAFQVPNNLVRPLDTTNTSIIETLAKNLTTEFTRSILADKLSSKNVTEWTVDIYLDAVEHVYKPLRSDFVIDQAYQQQAYDVLRRNIALGGYRLADILYEVLHREVPSANQHQEFLMI